LQRKTTRQAVQSLRSMQTEHEPHAQRAAAVVEEIAGYDRAVVEYLQGDHKSDFESIGVASDALDRTVNGYFNAPAGAGDDSGPPCSCALRSPITARRARRSRFLPAKRTAWLEHRPRLARWRAASDRLGRRGRPCNRGPAGAATASRSRTLPLLLTRYAQASVHPDVLEQKEKEFSAALARHNEELLRSPGKSMA
jgi:hypothetical protein